MYIQRCDCEAVGSISGSGWFDAMRPTNAKSSSGDPGNANKRADDKIYSTKLTQASLNVDSENYMLRRGGSEASRSRQHGCSIGPVTTPCESNIPLDCDMFYLRESLNTTTSNTTLNTKRSLLPDASLSNQNDVLNSGCARTLSFHTLLCTCYISCCCMCTSFCSADCHSCFHSLCVRYAASHACLRTTDDSQQGPTQDCDKVSENFIFDSRSFLIGKHEISGVSFQLEYLFILSAKKSEIVLLLQILCV